MDVLKGLFGGGDDAPQKQQQAQDFVNRYTQGAPDQGYTAQEAAQHYQSVAQNADPATIQRAAEQTFTGMAPDQRQQVSQVLQQQVGGTVSSDPREMAGTVAQLHQQNPGGLASMFGMGSGGGGLGGMLGNVLGGGSSSGGFPGGTLGKVALGGIAAYAMKDVLGGGGGLGGLLGGGGNDSGGGRSV